MHGCMLAGICGDPFSPRPGQPDTISSFNTKPCAPVATYSQGQTITITLDMPAYHGGFIQIRICPESNTNPSQSCFDANVLKLCAADLPSHLHCVCLGCSTRVCWGWCSCQYSIDDATGASVLQLGRVSAALAVLYAKSFSTQGRGSQAPPTSTPGSQER